MPRDNRCMYIVHVCFYVCCCDCVGVCGNVCCVAAVVKDSRLKYVVCLSKGCDGCCVFVCIMRRGAVGASCGSSQCCMTCSLLMLVDGARGDNMEEEYSRAGPITRCRWTISTRRPEGGRGVE